MKRNEQSGRSAPRQGSLMRQSHSGVSSFNVPAVSRFPPPEFLTQTQTSLWVAALSDVQLDFFRARHIPFMIQYVRAVEKMMFFSDQFEEDSEDTASLAMWERMIRITKGLETHLSLNTGALVSLVVRARAEHRVANQAKSVREAGEDDTNTRAGLVYVGH